MAAVPTGWSDVPAVCRRNASIEELFVRSGKGATGSPRNPSHAGAEKKSARLRMASREARMSNSVVRKAGLMVGASRGLLDLIVTDPPEDEKRYKY